MILFIVQSSELLCPTLCDPWAVASQALLFMEFSRQYYYGWVDLQEKNSEVKDLGSYFCVLLHQSAICIFQGFLYNNHH